MIVRKEKYYRKKINIINKNTCYDIQDRKRITYSLFGIIPIFIDDKAIGGQLENK